MEVKKSESLDYKIDFNDIFLREAGFGIADDYNDYIYDLDSNSIMQIKENFIKYNEELIPKLRSNELDLNLIENFRLAETLFSVYISKYMKRNGLLLNGYSQTKIRGSNKGKIVVTYKKVGSNIIETFESDSFENESLRIFNLICKLNHRTHLYDFNEFDITILKGK